MKRYEIFKRLAGTWKFQRTLTNRSSGEFLGSVKGLASITHLQPEVLHYQEKGELVNQLGQKLQIHREYLYSYDAKQDEIRKHFSENGKNVGLFYLLAFQNLVLEKDEAAIIIAKGDHLCGKDFYKAYYHFKLANSETDFTTFTLTYETTGPNKDYISETVFNSHQRVN